MSEVNEEKKEKCFVIMPISDQGDYSVGHFTKVYEQIIKPSVEEAGYEAYRVDENNICNSIINKIFSAIQECPMAVCDLSNRNPNVLYELGLRQAYDKPVVLIQDDKTDKIFDVSGISTVFYRSTGLYEDVMEARENIKKAILSTKKEKINTLAKIIKVNAADFSNIEVSRDDKTNVMLEGIYNEIKELKSKTQENYFHPVTARTKNSDTLYYNDNLTGEVTVNIIAECKDAEIINKFKTYIACLYGVKENYKKEVSENTWSFEIIFSNLESYKKAVESIKEFAYKLKIKLISAELYIKGYKLHMPLRM